MIPRWKINCRLGKAARCVSFGGAPLLRKDAQDGGEQFFAFAVAEGARPRVFTYDTGPDGVEALANLIRSEQVLSVVRGREAEFAELSVVEMRVAGKSFKHRTPLKEQRW